jgi:uncharacterized protein YqfA (UPF0365 family)
MYYGIKISMLDLIMMRLRKTPVKVIVDSLILANSANIDLTTLELETHFLAGGDIQKVIEAMVAAKKRGQAVDFRKFAAIDLAGLDLVEKVHNAIIKKTDLKLN